MPEDFLRAFQRSLNFDSGDDSKKGLDALLKFLKTEVESEERINLAMTGFDLMDASYKRESKLKKDKIFTSASLLTSSVGADKLCVFCSRKHEPTNCFKAQKMSYNEKLKVLKDKGYCFKCLKTGHRVGKCQCFVTWLVCNKMPYAVMCTVSNKNVNKPTSNNLEKEVKEQDKSLNLASISNAPQVLLQTLKVKITGKNCSLIVRALYDSRSQKSYYRKEMVSALGLAPLRQQLLSHALFGGERIKEKFHNVYKIELGSLDGSFNCNFDVVDQDIICNGVPSVSYGPWIRVAIYEHTNV
ncbi:integrase catalytic domain-containing protein [Trichonephila clavipes]|nr:integrase catalytic domain-containing protein [Trichonephila clavipes]